MNSKLKRLDDSSELQKVESVDLFSQINSFKFSGKATFLLNSHIFLKLDVVCQNVVNFSRNLRKHIQCFSQFRIFKAYL